MSSSLFLNQLTCHLPMAPRSALGGAGGCSTSVVALPVCCTAQVEGVFHLYSSCGHLLCSLAISALCPRVWFLRVQFQGYSQRYKRKYQTCFFRSQISQIMQSGHGSMESVSIMCSFQSAHVKTQR